MNRKKYRPPNPYTSQLPLFGGVDPDAFARHVRVEDYDITERRSGNAGGSAQANEAALPQKEQQRQQIADAIRKAGSRGLTLKEYSEESGIAMHRISGRFSELHEMGRIVRLTRRGIPVLRGRCAVWLSNMPF